MRNIYEYILEGFNLKINVVLIKGVNDDEITDFIEFTKDKNVVVQFIEFMPFDGNQWDTSKVVNFEDIYTKITAQYPKEQVIKLVDKKNDTAKHYRIKNYKGSFGVIATVSNPFCDSCNRMRLTANGRIKNCLFSSTEIDLLTPLRRGEDLLPYILGAVYQKKKSRGGMISDEEFMDKEKNTNNRAMISIGG